MKHGSILLMDETPVTTPYGDAYSVGSGSDGMDSRARGRFALGADRIYYEAQSSINS